MKQTQHELKNLAELEPLNIAAAATHGGKLCPANTETLPLN